MNKIKILAFIAIFAIFFACGSQDDENVAPLVIIPELAFDFIELSPYDTLVAEFNSKITRADSIIIPKSVKKVDSLGNKYYFVIGLESGSLDSIVFINLVNEHGYTKERVVLRYLPIIIFDNEPNDEEVTAGDINAFTNGRKFAGALNSDEDYFTLKISSRDYLDIKINSRSPLNVQFYRPGSEKKANLGKNKKVDSTRIRNLPEYLADGDMVGEEVDFYIRIYPEKWESPLNPYTLSVLRTKN